VPVGLGGGTGTSVHHATFTAKTRLDRGASVYNKYEVSMKRVIIESPLAAPSPEGIARNVRYARLCMLDCLSRGEAPFASHLLYTQVWNDLNEELRAKGIAAGHAWYGGADACVIYTDFGESEGMAIGIEAAIHSPGALAIERRTLPDELMAMVDGDGPEGTEGAASW